MKFKGLASGPASDNYEVSLRVSFGPQFHEGDISRGDFARKLRQFSKKRKNSFLGQMFEHFADHIEQAASEANNAGFALSAPANIHAVDTTYYGEGSCDDCSISHPGGGCCQCEYDGTTWCEPCG